MPMKTLELQYPMIQLLNKIVYIKMIIFVFISFSAAQIYDLSYIHLYKILYTLRSR